MKVILLVAISVWSYQRVNLVDTWFVDGYIVKRAILHEKEKYSEYWILLRVFTQCLCTGINGFICIYLASVLVLLQWYLLRPTVIITKW